MGKVIFWIVVVFVVLLGLRLLNASKGKRRAREPGEGAKRTDTPAETMVRCSTCGVFLPRTDARPIAGGFVCGDPGCAARR